MVEGSVSGPPPETSFGICPVYTNCNNSRSQEATRKEIETIRPQSKDNRLVVAKRQSLLEAFSKPPSKKKQKAKHKVRRRLCGLVL